MKDKILNMINSSTLKELNNSCIAVNLGITSRKCLKICRELVDDGKLKEERYGYNNIGFSLILNENSGPQGNDH